MYFTSFVYMPTGAAPMCPLHLKPPETSPQPVSLIVLLMKTCADLPCHHPQLHMALAMWHEGFDAAHQISLKAFVSMHARVAWVCLGLNVSNVSSWGSRLQGGGVFRSLGDTLQLRQSWGAYLQTPILSLLACRQARVSS